ncbi:cytoglobin-1-like [Protopterus annectens]|uniref:cytoglobin-1-like n=1 Tax=Protopterus annectens TaxID=7888 RepID=UPI001CFB3CC4|nr:cytoglobin-1-like [Protopterus annectens]
MSLATADIQKAKSVWQKFYVNAEDNGAIVLSRMFKEHPHTVSCFTNFKELQSIARTASVTELEGLSDVCTHGKKVLSSLNNMVQQVDNMDALKATIEPLGKKHAVELKVDVKEFENVQRTPTYCELLHKLQRTTVHCRNCLSYRT